MRNTRSRFVPVALGILLAGLTTFALADFREDFSKTLPLKAGERFSLVNVNGDVAVATWKENRVEIKAVKIARDDKEDLQDVEIRVEAVPGGVAVKAVWPKFRRRFNVNVDFEIQVPEGVNLESVETVNGEVGLSGLYAKASVGTTNGTVTVADAVGDFHASTTNGEIHADRVEGRLEAETTNGDVRLAGLAFKDGISAETTNGSITLILAAVESLNASLIAETTNGHITLDFPVTLKNLSQSKHRVEARIGEGGPEISLHTTNGSIRISK